MDFNNDQIGKPGRKAKCDKCGNLILGNAVETKEKKILHTFCFF